jgi:hypothetical protein
MVPLLPVAPGAAIPLENSNVTHNNGVQLITDIIFSPGESAILLSEPGIYFFAYGVALDGSSGSLLYALSVNGVVVANW